MTAGSGSSTRTSAGGSAIGDQRRAAELTRIVNEKAARGLLYSGALNRSLKLAAEGVREEWRNEVSIKLRELDAMVGAEGRLHELFRRVAGTRPGIELPADVQEKLARWREPLKAPGGDVIEIEDPASADLEASVSEFERSGRRDFPRISLLTGTPIET